MDVVLQIYHSGAPYFPMALTTHEQAASRDGGDFGRTCADERTPTPDRSDPVALPGVAVG